MSEKLPKAFDAYLRNLESLTNEVRKELNERKRKSLERDGLLIIKKDTPDSEKEKKSLDSESESKREKKSGSGELSEMEEELQGVLVELDSFRKQRENLNNSLA